MKLKVVQIGDPFLETTAKSVKNPGNQKIQKLIDNMIDTCKSEMDRTAGLSAPQVGEPLKISICRRFDLGEDTNKWEVMINPKILSKSKDRSTVWEGCLSIGEGDNALYGPVQRSKRVKVKFLDRQGNTKELDAKDYFSHVVQHELDHLDGVLFIKHIKNPDKNIWTSKELDKYIEQYGHFPDVV